MRGAVFLPPIKCRSLIESDRLGRWAQFVGLPRDVDRSQYDPGSFFDDHSHFGSEGQVVIFEDDGASLIEGREGGLNPLEGGIELELQWNRGLVL